MLDRHKECKPEREPPPPGNSLCASIHRLAKTNGQTVTVARRMRAGTGLEGANLDKARTVLALKAVDGGVQTSLMPTMRRAAAPG